MTALISEALIKLVSTGKLLTSLGLSAGSSGNLSVRVGEKIYVSPTGRHLDKLTVDDLSVINLDGDWLEGERPSKEHPLHSAFYRRSSAFSAIVHLHSTHATAVSCLKPWADNTAIPPITPYFVMRVGQVPLIPYAPPGDPSQAQLIEQKKLPFRAVLLQNHGMVVAGRSLSEAVDAAIELEEVCKLLLLIRSREVKTLTKGEVQFLAQKYTSPWTSE